MDPIGLFVAAAGVAGVTKALSSNADRIISALESSWRHHSGGQQENRIVVVETVIPDASPSGNGEPSTLPEAQIRS